MLQKGITCVAGILWGYIAKKSMIVDSITFGRIKEFYIEEIKQVRYRKAYNKKRKENSMLARIIKRRGLFFTAALIFFALWASIYVINQVCKNPPAKLEVCMIIALLICTLIMEGIAIDEIITESSGYVSAIKAVISADEIGKMANFLKYNIGISCERTISEIISFQESRKKRVEDYRVNKTEIIVAFLSGITGLTAVKSLLEKGAESGNEVLMTIVLLVSLCIFIVNVLKKFGLHRYWSDTDEELLDMLSLVKLNAHSLGFR